MKNIVILAVLLVISCNKKAEPSSTNTGDTLQQLDTMVPPLSEDTTQSDLATFQKVQSEKIKGLRTVEGHQIIKTIDAQMLPISIYDEFTPEVPQMIIKIKNFKGTQISGEINPEHSKMNIRFNQLKNPDGSYDGPFSRQIFAVIKEEGEIWLLIGKSNMASGETSGKFTVNLQ